MQTQIRRWLLIWTYFSTHCKVLNGMKNERVKILPATELDHFLSTEFVFNEQTHETLTRAQGTATISNYCHGIVQNEKKRRTVIERDDEDWLKVSDCIFINCVYVWMIFTGSNFDISSSIFCDEQVKIFHAETIFRISANYSCWDFWQLSLQIVLEVLLIFNMIYVHWICFQTRQW